MKRGRPAQPVSLICPLRKPCTICGEPYGRKLRTRFDGYQYLEHITMWEASQSCSKPCKYKLRARTIRARVPSIEAREAMRMFIL